MATDQTSSNPPPPELEPENGRVIPRRIFIHWEEGINTAPDLVQFCIQSWRSHNPDWKLSILHHSHISDEGILPMPQKHWQLLPPAQRGEWISLWHLAHHGGIWVEPTSLCLQPLETWIDEAVHPSGFFAFSSVGAKPAPATWFMAALPNNSLPVTLLHLYEKRLRAFQRWKQSGIAASGPGWRLRNAFRRAIGKPPIGNPLLGPLTREIFHTIEGCRRIWSRTPKRPAAEPETLQRCGLHAPANNEVRRFLDKLPSPLVRIGNDSAKLEGEPGTAMALLLDKNLHSKVITAPPPFDFRQPNEIHPWSQLVVVGSVRSGTTVFRKMLSTAPAFTDFGEVVHPHLHGPRNWFFWLAKQGPVHPTEYSNLWPLFLSMSKHPKEIALLDIKVEALHLVRDPVSDLPWPPFIMLHPKMETRIVRIKRRNTLAQVLSWERLLRTGVATRMDGMNTASSRIELDPEQVVAKIQEFHYRDTVADQLIGQPDLTVYYEDMFEPDGTFKTEILESCAALFQIDPGKFTQRPPMEKVGKKGDLVNRDEIVEALKPTPYAWMCEDL